jgi:hypothetical protein
MVPTNIIKNNFPDITASKNKQHEEYLSLSQVINMKSKCQFYIET